MYFGGENLQFQLESKELSQLDKNWQNIISVSKPIELVMKKIFNKVV